MFPNSNHDSGFCKQAACLELFQHIQRSFITRLWTNGGMHAPNSFHVVTNDSWTSITHDLNSFFVSTKITDKNFNTHLRTRRARETNCLCPYFGTTIWQLIAIDACDDHMFQIH
jgi:hypothetical protein